jgi:putative transposase
MDLLQQRDPIVPLRTACRALDIPRSTVYRRLNPRPRPAPKPRRPSPRRLADTERQRVLELLHSERFADQPPREAYAELLEEGTYVASIRTMYRLLAEQGESRERRNQRAPRHFPVPSVAATAPNQVWTWDISKLPTLQAGIFLNLYVILDLWSRYVVAWMIAERENSALAKQLFAEAITRYGVDPDVLTVHMDRGAPMTSLGFAELLGALRVERSYSRPRVSNDNPHSESLFKTAKYQPDYPARFHGPRDARAWATDFFDWYNVCHHHEGIALYTPETLFLGRVEEVAAVRQRALDAAYQKNPERFVRGRPIAKRPPAIAAINPAPPEATVPASELVVAQDPQALFPQKSILDTPSVAVLPGAIATGSSGRPQGGEELRT